MINQSGVEETLIRTGMEEIPTWMPEAIGFSLPDLKERLPQLEPGELVGRLVFHLKQHPERVGETWRFASAHYQAKESSVIRVESFDVARRAGLRQALAYVALQAIQNPAIAPMLSKSGIHRRSFLQIGLSFLGCAITGGFPGLLAGSLKTSSLVTNPGFDPLLTLSGADALEMLAMMQRRVLLARGLTGSPGFNEEAVGKLQLQDLLSLENASTLEGRLFRLIPSLAREMRRPDDSKRTPESIRALYERYLQRDLGVRKILVSELRHRAETQGVHGKIVKLVEQRLTRQEISIWNVYPEIEVDYAVKDAFEQITGDVLGKDPAILTERWAQEAVQNLVDPRKPFLRKIIGDAVKSSKEGSEAFKEFEQPGGDKAKEFRLETTQDIEPGQAGALAIPPPLRSLSAWIASAASEGPVELVAEWNWAGETPFSVLLRRDKGLPMERWESPTEHDRGGLAALALTGRRLPPGWVTRVQFEKGVADPDVAARLQEAVLSAPLSASESDEMGIGVLVVEAGVLSQRTGLEEFIRRVIPLINVPVIVTGRDSLTAAEMAGQGVVAVNSDNLVDLAIVLAGMEEADRVVYMGDSVRAGLLGRMLPNSMSVIGLGPGEGLDRVLLSLGFPRSIIEEIDAAGMEENFARLHSA